MAQRIDLADFMEMYREAIAGAVIATYPPRYNATARREHELDLHRLRRRPPGAQADAIRAVAISLRQQGSTNLVAEMGTGKTYIAAAAASLAGCRRVLVLCPPHLVGKWAREIGQTVPGARVATIRALADLRGVVAAVRQPSGIGDDRGCPILFVVCSREGAKLGYRWSPAAVARLAAAPGVGIARDEAGGPLRALCCPDCFAPLADDEGVPLTRDDLAAKKRRCPACGSPLWSADRAGPRRYPLADYIRRRLPGYFDLLIGDEIHEFKARGSAQGLAAGALAEACGRTLTLTGTIFGGYASTLFHLLWRFSPAVRADFGYRDEAKWVGRYGIVHRITRRDPDARLADGRHSKRRTYATRIVEKPGVALAILLHLLPNSVFLRLGDVARDLPPYAESITLVPLDRGEDPGDPAAPSQARGYRTLADGLRAAVRAALARGSKRLLGTYLQALLTYPDACAAGETVLDPATGAIIAHAPPLPEGAIYPKERALLDLVARARGRGRRVLVYLTHTEARDLSPRLVGLLAGAGSAVAVLKAGTVPPERREAWVEARVRAGADVLLTHPRLVATGLDYVEYRSASSLAVSVGTGPRGRAARIPGFAYEGPLRRQNQGWQGLRAAGRQHRECAPGGRGSRDSQEASAVPVAPEVARGRPRRRRDVGKLREQPLVRGDPILDRRPLLVRERDLLAQPQQVGFAFQQLRCRRAFRPIEGALGAGHAVRALVEEVVGAVAVPEVVEPPRLARRRRPVPDGVPVEEQFDGAQITAEIARVLVGPGKLGRRDAGVVLRGGRRAMPEPGLQVEQRQRLPGVEELAGDRRAGAVAGDGPARVALWHPGLAAEQRDEAGVEVPRADRLGAVGEEEVHRLAGLGIGQRGLRGPERFPGGDGLPDDAVHRLGEGRLRLVDRHVQ